MLWVRAPKKIGLLHHVGGGNLGDDASLDAVMHNIKSRWPDSVIFGFSMNPSDTQTRHAIPSYPLRTETWNLVEQPVNSLPCFYPDRLDIVKQAEQAYKHYRARHFLASDRKFHSFWCDWHAKRQ